MGRFGALVAKGFPIAAVPIAVCLLQPGTWEEGLPLVFLGLACGILISAALPRLLLSLPAVLVMVGLLLSVAHMHDLHAAETRWHHEHSQLVLQGKSPHGGLGVPHSIAESKLRGGAAVQAAAAVVDPSSIRGPTAATGASIANLAPATLETLSVVLPCAFEGGFAVKTVEAIWGRSKQSRIHEIIVVDDGSDPPLRQQFPESLLAGGAGVAPAKIIRHDKTLGLIAAKKTGGDAATGDIIVFFDCHISPREGWEEAFIKQMKRAGDHRTVVVPTITSLDPDTWQEIQQGGAAGMGCYFTWNADFTWLQLRGDGNKQDVPLMSGGLLAISRRWWQETGGYDRRMVAWGGENIDQSLRIWMCGGRIELAEGAFVAHMWRDAKNPKTKLRYPIPTADVMRNKARAVSAWFDEFKEKTLHGFPEYSMFFNGDDHIGDMSDFDAVKSRLQCAPFSSYISRFSYVYLDAGFIPETIYQLREESSGRCLQRAAKESPPHGVILGPCAGGDKDDDRGKISEVQLWHPSNRHRERNDKCCSGLSNWNFNQCLEARMGLGSLLQTVECEISGGMPGQHIELTSDGQLSWRNGAGCVAPTQTIFSIAQYATVASCTATWEAVGPDVFKTADGKRVPKTFRLRSHNWPSATKGMCAGGSGQQAEATSAGFTLQFEPCADDESQQILRATPMLGGYQIHMGSGENCLDSVSGTQLLVYPCYDEATGNLNQVWDVAMSGRLVWKGNQASTHCVSSPPEPPKADKTSDYSLASCSPKAGQLLHRDAGGHADGTFMLVANNSKQCLGLAPPDAGVVERRLKSVPCHSADRWRELPQSEQVQHVSTTFCLDAGPGSDSPIVYPCHTPKAQHTQRWQVVDNPGWVLLKEDWADNGRKRYFERCLDSLPETPIPAGLRECERTKSMGIRWTKIGIRVPRERELWDKAEKPGPGVPPLGEAR